MENIEEQRRKNLKRILLVLIPLLVVVFIANFIKDSSQEDDFLNSQNKRPQQGVARVISIDNLQSLLKDFSNNGPSFLNKYRDVRLEFSAVVKDVSEFGASYLVHFEDGESFSSGLPCYFDSDKKNQVLRLNRGMKVKVRGRAGQAEFGTNLVFYDCEIIN